MTRQQRNNEADKTRAARELHQPRAPHRPGCGQPLTLADVLKMTCPHCGATTFQGLAPDVTPLRARQMLAELERVRRRLEALTRDRQPA